MVKLCEYPVNQLSCAHGLPRRRILVCTCDSIITCRPGTFSEFDDSVFDTFGKVSGGVGGDATVRHMRLLWSPYAPPACCRYTITASGVAGVGE
jgi:hypothetical protein